MSAAQDPVAFYTALFSDAARASVYHLPHGDRAALLEGAAAADCLVLTVDLAQARSREAMFAAIGASLRFPGWFGDNWDALSDCLADMGWLPALGYVIILEHCDGIHARAEDDFVTLMQLLQEVADEWREEGVPFWCLVDMLADGIAWLPTVAQPE
jgi:RNAse (barnase) inhibitor barstar